MEAQRREKIDFQGEKTKMRKWNGTESNIEFSFHRQVAKEMNSVVCVLAWVFCRFLIYKNELSFID